MKTKELQATPCVVLLNYLAWAEKYLEEVNGLTQEETERINNKIDDFKNKINAKQMLI